jgi:tight adherence protein B
MTTTAWLLLGLGLGLLPVASRAAGRTRRLAADGRLRVVAVRRSRPGLIRLPVGAAAGCVGLAATGLGWWAGGAALALSAAIGTGAAGRVLLAAARARAERRAAGELLTGLRLLAAELDAGARPDAALVAASGASARHRAELCAAAAAAERGEPPQFRAAELAPLAAAWHVSDRAGAPLALVVGRVAGELAARADQQRAVRTAVAGAQSSAALLTVLPALGLVLGVAMGARPQHVLLDTAAGRLLGLAGVALDAAGLLWTARLTTRASRP